MQIISIRNLLGVSGEKIFPEEELLHLDGHKGSKPVRLVAAVFCATMRAVCIACICNRKLFLAAVSPEFEEYIDADRDTRRIGNGAIDHIQLVNLTFLCYWFPGALFRSASFLLRVAERLGHMLMISWPSVNYLRTFMVNCKYHLQAPIPMSAFSNHSRSQLLIFWSF